MVSNVIAAILAGGKSTRLGGEPKGFLKIDGRRIIDHQLDLLRKFFHRIVIVANDQTPWVSLGLPLLADRHPGAGPLAGIEAALLSLTDHQSAAVCLASDMPFINSEVIELLIGTAPHAPLVVPRIGGHAEPLCARYGRVCLPGIATALAENRLKTSAFLETAGTHWIDESIFRAADPALLSLENVNTPADYDRLDRSSGGRR